MAEVQEVKIGDAIPDGTILAGYYEGKPLYATPEDAPGTYTFNEAAKYASSLDTHGHNDFHVPSKGELNVLWENRNEGKLKGTFNEAGQYWTADAPFGACVHAYVQSFRSGEQLIGYTSESSFLRCVR
jgi:hypothetical protein